MKRNRNLAMQRYWKVIHSYHKHFPEISITIIKKILKERVEWKNDWDVYNLLEELSK